ncbi:MAG: YadA-like family protein [Acidaminococcaceae bacterium]|nr:YadA-like family protein [Acidaminococcaceae bacterium]
MNKIYKVIWSKARNCYVVVSELAKRNGKCKAAKTDNVNEGNLLNGMSGATSLHKAAAALLLAGMIAMPGVSEAGQINIGTYSAGTEQGTVSGTNAIGIGTGIYAKGNNSIASGNGAKAYGMDSIALGKNAQALLDQNPGNSGPARAIAIGADAQALGNRSIAIGDTAYVDSRRGFSTAIGAFAKVEHQYSTAVGSYATATANNSAAFGRETLASGERALAMGNFSQATGNYSIAIGSGDTSFTTHAPLASAEDAIAIGRFTKASGEGSVALGRLSEAAGENAVGLGNDTRARTANSVAIGSDAGHTTMDSNGVITRNYVVYEYDDENKIKLDANGKPIYTIATEPLTITAAIDTENGGNSIAIGNNARNMTLNYDATDQSYALTKDSIAIGARTRTNAAYAVAIGANTGATGERALAIGTSSTSSDAAYTGAHAAGQGSIVIGDQARAFSQKLLYDDERYSSERTRDEDVNDAIAVGTKAEARARNSLALGGNMSYSYKNGNAYETVYGTGSDGRTFGAITGDGAEAAIAIGGASGSVDTTTSGTPTITITHNPAGAFGKGSIAIGTGALVETKTNHDDLAALNEKNKTVVAEYNKAQADYNTALEKYNTARIKFQAYTSPVEKPTQVEEPTNPEDPDYDEKYRKYGEYLEALEKYNTYVAYKTEFETASDELFGSNGASKQLLEKTAAYESYMNQKRQLEEADAFSSDPEKSVENAIAIGTAAEARAKEGIAFGDSTLIREGAHQSVAIGHEATIQKNAAEAVAIGEDAQVGTYGVSSIAIGNDANTGAYSTQSIAIGYHAMTKGTESNKGAIPDAIAIGSNTKVFGSTSIAIGSMSEVSGMYSGVIGSEVPSLDINHPEDKEHSSVTGNYSYAIGNGNKIGKQDVTERVLRKEGAEDVPENYVTVPTNDSSTNRVYAIGARNIVGETGNTEYVNVVGFKNTIDTTKNASVFGEYNTVKNSNSSLIIGKYHNVEGATNSLLIGGHPNVKTTTTGLTDVLIYGFEATLKDDIKESVGIGKSVTLKADNAIAIGTGATVEGNNSISIGTGNVVTGANSGAFGDPSTIDGANSYSVGNNNTIAEGKANVFALGNNITSVESDSVFLGSNSAYVATTTADTATTKGTDKTYTSATINGITYYFAGGSNVAGVVSVGDVGKERRIQNVAPGLISAASTDAVNGSQLYAVINSGWKVGDNNSTAQATIASTRQVNYINGNGTTSKVTQVKDPADANKVIGANVQYDVNRSTITVGTNGTVTADTPDTSTTSYFATATTVQNAINNSGWNVTSSANGGTASNSTTKLVNPGSTVEYVAGSGIKITQEQDGTKTKFTFEADASSGGSGSNITDESNKIIKQVTTDKRSTNAYANSDGLWTVTTPYIDIHGTADETGEAKDHWSRAMAQRAVAIGHDSKVDEIANDGLAAGTGNMVASQKGLAIGAKNTVGLNADESMAIGSNNTVSGQQSQAIGSGNTVTGAQSIAIGTGHRVTGSRSGAIGDPNIVNASNSYAVGNNSNIAAGQTDVFAFGNDIKKTTSNSVFLGSNTAYVPEGATTAGMSDYSSATISGKTYNFAGGKPAGVVSVGDVGKERRIQNVAAGKVSPESTDAVNGSQLYHAMNDTAQAVTQDVTGMMHQQEGRLRKGIAGAAALAALHPLEFDPDDKLSFAAGVGSYRGETAAAIGAFYRADEKTMFSIGGSMGNGENVVNAGVSFSLDRTPRKTSSRAAMAREIVELREQVAQLTAIVNQLAGGQLPVAPVMYPNTPENAWAYEYLENLQKQGTIVGYTGRELSRAEFAAALDRAAASGVTLDERIVNEFASELSRVNIAYVNGKGNDEGKIFARPRVTSAKAK